MDIIPEKITWRLEDNGLVINDILTLPHPNNENIPLKIREEYGARYTAALIWAQENPDKVELQEPYAPTEEQLLEVQAAQTRIQRNIKLKESDYLLAPDYPISEEDKQKVVEYRTALRNITAQEGFPENVEWPVLDLDYKTDTAALYRTANAPIPPVTYSYQEARMSKSRSVVPNLEDLSNYDPDFGMPEDLAADFEKAGYEDWASFGKDHPIEAGVPAAIHSPHLVQELNSVEQDALKTLGEILTAQQSNTNK